MKGRTGIAGAALLFCPGFSVQWISFGRSCIGPCPALGSSSDPGFHEKSFYRAGQ